MVDIILMLLTSHNCVKSLYFFYLLNLFLNKKYSLYLIVLVCISDDSENV